MTPKELVDRAVVLLGKDGILPVYKYGKLAFESTQKPGGPWIYIRYSKNNCTLLRTFIYQLISKRLPEKERFIPSVCLDCHKVVVRPETFDDLHALRKIMEEMDFPSKCGIERRESVDALFGGYFYCYGYEEGKKRLEQVEFGLLNTGMKAFLKRGCTEYEEEFGPSDIWEAVPGQEEIEAEVERRIVIENYKYPQSKFDIKMIESEWKEFVDEVGSEHKGSHEYKTYPPKEVRTQKMEATQ